MKTSTVLEPSESCGLPYLHSPETRKELTFTLGVPEGDTAYEGHYE